MFKCQGLILGVIGHHDIPKLINNHSSWIIRYLGLDTNWIQTDGTDLKGCQAEHVCKESMFLLSLPFLFSFLGHLPMSPIKWNRLRHIITRLRSFIRLLKCPNVIHLGILRQCRTDNFQMTMKLWPIQSRWYRSAFSLRLAWTYFHTVAVMVKNVCSAPIKRLKEEEVQHADILLITSNRFCADDRKRHMSTPVFIVSEEENMV